MNLARIGNKYLADTEPWKLAKTDMERTATILHLALQIAANLSIAFEPFLPFSAKKLRNMLSINDFNWEMLGSIDILKENAELGKAELLFEKIEDSEIDKQIQRLKNIKIENEKNNFKPEPIKEKVDFETWEKTDIRVGTVLECTKVPKADKLLQFKIDDGTGERVIVSGIAQSYPNPEELVGTQVLFIANFEPRKLKGIVSNGMILSAVNADGKLVLCTPSKEVKPGCQVG